MAQGNILKLLGKLDDAEKKYDQVLKIDVENKEIAFHLGDIAFEQKSFHKALAYYTKFLDTFIEYCQEMEADKQCMIMYVSSRWRFRSIVCRIAI